LRNIAPCDFHFPCISGLQRDRASILVDYFTGQPVAVRQLDRVGMCELAQQAERNECHHTSNGKSSHQYFLSKAKFESAAKSSQPDYQQIQQYSHNK
jgi:hypothetical protein